MSQIDDSALFHGRNYNPQKAHEYYLRTRHLKGRSPAAKNGSGGSSSGGHPGSGGSSPGAQGTNTHIRPSRRAELEAQRKQLENRLDHLRQVLEAKVAAAKKRAGVKEPPKAQTTSTTSTSKTKKGAKGTPDKPLTEAQKRDKREAAKEQYAKENHTSLAQEVQTLQRQVQDIRAKIEKAINDARQQHSQSTQQTASNGR